MLNAIIASSETGSVFLQWVEYATDFGQKSQLVIRGMVICQLHQFPNQSQDENTRSGGAAETEFLQQFLDIDNIFLRRDHDDPHTG